MIGSSSRTPACSAWSISAWCSVVRRIPSPWPRGNRASTEVAPSQKRIPGKRRPGAPSRSIPSARAAASPSGMIPSPQGLSIGGRSASATVTSKPRRRAAIAAARPAGPPPMMNRSVEEGKIIRSDIGGLPRHPQGFGPEQSGGMRQFHHRANRRDELAHLLLRDHQRWRHL